VKRRRPTRPGVVAVTMHERGGGIAAVSRLVASVLRERATAEVPVYTLTDVPRGRAFSTSLVDRLWFGSRVAAAQCVGQCDWLFFTHLSLAVVQRAVPGWCRKPYAVFLHDVEAWQPLPPARARVLAGAFLRVANSSYTAKRVADANPGVGPIAACPLALPVEWAARPSAEEQVRRSPRVVLTVGRMMASERYKGHDQLLEAWPLVLAAVPDAQLVCAGEGDDIPRLRAKAASLGVAHAVVFTGFVSETERQAWYERADLFAMPSRREGFGLVYLEAMASGLPCIASVHDAAPGIVSDGDTGLLVDQGDIGGLSRALGWLLTDDDARRRMGRAGRRRFLAEFTHEAFARRLLGLVDAVHPIAARVPVMDVSHSDL
jgi:phosphatidyl-myo-inositol dimannoside synthase